MNTIEKYSWDEIKHKVMAINPSFYEAIEPIKALKRPLFFIAKYDFGEHFGVNNHAYLPSPSGALLRIDDKQTEHELYCHLGYGKNSLPLGMILNKYCEWHYFGENGRIFPDCIQGPGAIFNMQVIFDEDQTVDNNVLSVSSGALSSFLLPNIGCKRKHARLQKNFNILSPSPKSPYEHYLVFKELLQNKKPNSQWQSEVLYFSKSFVDEVKSNHQCLNLKLYFSESLRKKLTENTYNASCNDLFLSAKKVNRFRPTPFIIDTAKYIFNICMGSGIGVKPATDEQYFPVHAIQEIYHRCYGLEYTPTVMVPASLKENNTSIYYPLQCPFAKINTFKTNQSNSTYRELEILRNVLLSYQDEFTAIGGATFGSPLYKVSKNTQFSFYHYQSSGNQNIKPSTELQGIDAGFLYSYNKVASNFASDAKLFRGLVRLSR